MPDTPPRDETRRDPNAPGRDYPAEDARQGEIVLRSRRRKAIFFGGLGALVLLALIWTLVIGAAA